MVLTLYLLIDEMRNFLITKPTLTSVTHTKLKPESFPNILICSEEGFDIDSLQRLEYYHAFYYGVGSVSNSEDIGWLGNQTEMNITEVVNEISKIKTLNDCPKIKGKFKLNGKHETIQVRMNVTRVLYPFGRCCRVLKPKEADKYAFDFIYSYKKFSEFNNYTNGFSMYLSDEKSGLIQPQRFALEGHQLKYSRKQSGYVNYRIKVVEYHHLENDPHYPCRNYNFEGEYNQCLEKEYTNQILKILNCTPPWMTDNMNFWCQDKGNGIKKDKALFVLGNIEE